MIMIDELVLELKKKKKTRTRGITEIEFKIVQNHQDTPSQMIIKKITRSFDP